MKKITDCVLLPLNRAVNRSVFDGITIIVEDVVDTAISGRVSVAVDGAVYVPVRKEVSEEAWELR